MSEYIEREALVEKLGYKLTRVAGYIRREISGVDLNAILSTLELCQIVRDFPAADVEPVKHGRWVKNIRGNYAKVCSECGAGILTIDYTPILLECNRASYEREQMYDLADVVKYCPNCGAKMDEVSE